MSTYFEDYVVGEEVELGQTTFTREDIIAFASRFDPQPFHLDEEAARHSILGGLCASGWHTASQWLRHVLDHRKRINDRARFRGERVARHGPSPGFEKLRWLKPVRAGDTIRFRTRVKEKVPSRSEPGIGLVISENEGWNQNGELVFTVIGKIFVERREPGDTATP
jgi:acyl dehydratase